MPALRDAPQVRPSLAVASVAASGGRAAGLRRLAIAALALAALTNGGCGARATRGREPGVAPAGANRTPRATQAAASAGLTLAPPREGLPLGEVDRAWAPPALVTGDLAGLGARMAAAGRVEVALAPALAGAASGAEVLAALAARAPEAAFAPTLALELQEWLGVEQLPLARAQTADGDSPWTPLGLTAPDAAGAWERAPVVGAWQTPDPSRAQRPTAPAGLRVWIGPAPIDPARWSATPTRAVDSCEPAWRDLAAGQARALAALEAVLDATDARLAAVHRELLAARWQVWTDALAPYVARRARAEFDTEVQWQRHECGHATVRWLQAHRACFDTAQACELAPRLLLVDGLSVGAGAPSVFVAEDCPRQLGVPVQAEVQQAARAAAATVVRELDPGWAALADRLAALGDIGAVLDDACTPRRRRYALTDVETARDELAAAVALLAAPPPAPGAAPEGEWLAGEGSFHVPGLGPLERLAQWRPAPASAVVQARARVAVLRELLQRRAQCTAGAGELPLAIVVAPATGGPVTWLDFVSEAELRCPVLGPAAAH